MRAVATLLCLAAFAVGAAPAAAQSDSSPPGCVGDTESDAVAQRPGGERLRFGVTPGVQTGQIGTAPAPAVPTATATGWSTP